MPHWDIDAPLACHRPADVSLPLLAYYYLLADYRPISISLLLAYFRPTGLSLPQWHITTYWQIIVHRCIIARMAYHYLLAFYHPTGVSLPHCIPLTHWHFKPCLFHNPWSASPNPIFSHPQSHA